jgi:6-pyruvoyltetrahydropterin/6-carboxytetrahydropterin synthase
MYKLAVKKDFIAQHFLVGGDWGSENQKHSHHYRLEIQLEGKDLDNHGYLVDIAKIKNYLEQLISHYQDQTLNELPEFKDINPSIENMARIFYQSLCRSIRETGLSGLKVKVWEDEMAWITYHEDKLCASDF